MSAPSAAGVDSAARFHEVRRVFLEARRIPAQERATFVAAACGGDLLLRDEVLALLAQEGAAFLDRPVLRPEGMPERLGRFRLLAEIGRGAAGAVWRVEQENPRREVAVKVLRAHCASADAARRFAREAAVLGALQHPSIAAIYEAGIAATPQGRLPWIAMELVRGEPITAHARRCGLPLAERVRLVAEVAGALHHAHERGVVHRDLKPSNVLVDEGGRPKVVDFGSALWAGADSLVTAPGTLLGTLAYMSPEQAEGGRRVDARADVYSLGAILYELATGVPPIDVRRRSVPEALRAIRESEPTPARALRRGVGRDLEAVLARALEKDPARRYPSARAFALELRRHLAGEPVEARRPSVLAQARNLARRHRSLVAATAIAFAALAVAASAASAGLLFARGAEHRAEAERDALLRLSDEALLEELEERAERELWPAAPERAPAMEAWLAEARPIAAGLPAHRARLEQLLEGELAVEGRLSAADRSWLDERQSRLVERLEAFVDPEHGLVAEIERRLATAGELAHRTIALHRRAWERAIASIADPDACPAYGGLRIAPQVGLVPLGRDRRSGLWEFALHGSGRIPQRSAPGGELGIDSGSAIVLVLVPGGTALLGAQSGDRSRPRFDSFANWHEGPPREIELAPYFLAKHEMTRAQWLRAAGRLPPSLPFYAEVSGEERLSRPAASVSWHDAVGVLRRFGLELPSEAQWEHAARGGTDTPWPSGGDPLDLRGRVKMRTAELGEWLPCAGLDSEPTVVGRFAPNAYGLHDMLGNVREWCRDPYSPSFDAWERRAGDGLVLAPDDGYRPLRGGAYDGCFRICRIACRHGVRAEALEFASGVRPARPLAPPAGAERRGR